LRFCQLFGYSDNIGGIDVTIAEAIIERLNRLSIEDQQRVLEVVTRLSVDQPIDPLQATKKDADSPTIFEKLARLGEAVESEDCYLPEDLAQNHDFYLHGLPKRQ
jgi:hypothetical protein